MSSWTLDQDSELNVLIPWLDREPDREKRARVVAWIADLVRAPVERGVEDEAGFASALVPGADTTVIWALDTDNLLVVLLHVGPA